LIDFPNKKYKIIYADPPWEYDDKLNMAYGGAEAHYETLTPEEIKNLPIKKISCDDSWLFLWATWPNLQTALQVINSWDFEYRTVAFVWIKTYSNGKYHLGLGQYTRGNTEFCLLARKGNPRRINNSISQLIFSPVGKHSKKPDTTRNKIIQLCGDLPRIELFARTKVHGWDVWGNDPKLESEPLEAFS